MEIKIIYSINNIVLHHFIIKSNKIWIKENNEIKEINIKNINKLIDYEIPTYRDQINEIDQLLRFINSFLNNYNLEERQMGFKIIG